MTAQDNNAQAGDSDAIESLPFEQALARLDTTIQEIERGEIGLEASLKAYGEGEQLIARCRALLEKAEQQIKTIRVDDIAAEANSTDAQSS